jgi:hypothetical protein
MADSWYRKVQAKKVYPAFRIASSAARTKNPDRDSPIFSAYSSAEGYSGTGT